MSVAIRLAVKARRSLRSTASSLPDKRKARDGNSSSARAYHPQTKVLKLDTERYEKWLKVGAQPSGTVASIIRRTARAAAAAPKPA